MAGTPFVAIDFETADYGADSACAVGLVRVEDGAIAARWHTLIRPPRRGFIFTGLHGISWRQVRDKPRFAEIWPEVREFCAGAGFLAAHNARFDRGVLEACCQAADISPPEYRFLCTVSLARRAWGIHPTRLTDVCRRLGIALDHHQALSDAEACARIVMAAQRDGVALLQPA